MTEAQLEILRDRYVVWERASRTGNMELRDYNRRCAEALKEALCIIAASPLGGPILTLDELKPVPIGGDGEGDSSNASLRRTLPGAHTEAEPAAEGEP